MVRSFTTDPVETETVDALIRAILSGPSAGNTRSLEVLVLSGDDAHKYWEVTLSADRRSAFPWPRLLDAPLLLIPYVRPAAYVQRYAEADKASTGLGEGLEQWSVPYWWVDGGAAVENVLLAVSEFDLGACFFGQFEHEDAVRTRFGVPNAYRAVGTIAVGHPDGNDRKSKSARRPHPHTSQVTHWGSW